jgi:excinuclease ABC subunit C
MIKMDSQYYKKAKLPDSPGVYFFKRGREVLYIGKATSLRDRVKSYFAKDLIATRGPLLVDLIFQANKIDFIKTNSVLEALILESNLIKKYQPRYNTKEKDDRSYNYVVITKEEFPRVLIVREKEIKLGLPYEVRSKFGPYPNNTQLKQVMALIRKIFPFRDRCSPSIDGKQNKPCFNYQIGLCPGICCGMILAKNYLSIIKNIELFLGSKNSQLIKNLNKEMKACAKLKQFEAAKKVRDTIFALQHIRDVSLIREERTSQVADFRIEAYDAAHFGGQENVGVMVVMENGELKKSDYRKFKIRNSVGDDIGALKEMLERRLKHTEWALPNLIVADGGLTQLGAARQVIGKSIELVAVTKDEKHKAKAIIGDENLVKKYKKEILQVNAEAHRFAIAFHRRSGRIFYRS